MWDNKEEINKVLKHLEKFQLSLMTAYNELDGHDYSFEKNPLAKVKPMIINGFPVFQFSYDGLLPVYKGQDRELTAMIRNYYNQVTKDAYDFHQIDYRFDKAVIMIQHFFNDHSIRDLDNRNRKYIIDAIRHTGLIEDDNWKHLSIFEQGLSDERSNHVQVYLFDYENLSVFINYMKIHSHDLKSVPTADLKEKIFEDFRKKEQEERENEEEMLYLFELDINKKKTVKKS